MAPLGGLGDGSVLQLAAPLDQQWHRRMVDELPLGILCHYLDTRQHYNEHAAFLTTHNNPTYAVA
jgi:hypothetical protein